jgi:hypothetical protein
MMAWRAESWWWRIFSSFGNAIGAFVAAATPTFPIVDPAIVDFRPGGWCPALGLFLQIDDGRF